MLGACSADLKGTGLDPAEDPGGDDGWQDPAGDEAQAIDDVVEQAGELEVDPAQPLTELGCGDGLCPADGQEGEYFCSYRRFSETTLLDDFIALQPNSATLWPGSVVHGQDAHNGLLTPLGLSQAPVTFSVSLENLGGSPVGRMDAPSLSSFREERNRILSADVAGATPAALRFEMVEVHSASQLALALRAGASWPGLADIEAGFDFNSQQSLTRILVDFVQAYYTIDVDAPQRPSAFFDPGVTAEEVAARVGAGDPPVYVQSVTFGRRAVFSVETSEAASEMQAALEAAYTGIASGFGASVEMSAEHRRRIEESRIRAVVFGGSGAEAATLIDGVEALTDFIRNGGDYGHDSPGAPLAYKLAYLDNAVTELAFAAEYTARECVRNRTDLQATLVELAHLGGGDVGGNVEVYGHVSLRYPTAEAPDVRCGEGGAVVDLWRLADGQWVDVRENESWRPESPRTVRIEDAVVGPDAHLCVSTDLWDEDEATHELTADDFYGHDELLITLAPGAAWQGDVVLHPRGDGDRAIDVTVSLSVP